MKVYKKHNEVSSDFWLSTYIANNQRHTNDTDVTTANSLWEYFRVGVIDYIQFRDYAKQNLLPKFETLSELEKQFLISHSVKPENIAISFEDYLIVVEMEYKARSERWKKALSVGGHYYFSNNAYQFMMYQDCKAFRNDYIEANLPIILLWLNSAKSVELNVDFTQNGFASKPYYTNELKELLISCFVK